MELQRQAVERKDASDWCHGRSEASLSGCRGMTYFTVLCTVHGLTLQTS